MSSKTSRKAVPEEKDKRPAESPGKEIKKKMAANPEKEKPVDKPADKPTEKATDKPADKKTEKKPEEKAKEDKGEKSSKDERNGNATKKQNGGANGTQNGGHKNGTEDANGTVSEEDDIMEDDEIFPELTYEDSDMESFDLRSEGPSRSFTRRSQAKVTRTPETPRPASDKAEKDDDSKDSKVLKLKEDAPPAAERKLRSTDSPKPESKKETPKKDDAKKTDDAKKEEVKTSDVVKDASKKTEEVVKENGEKEKREVEVVVVLENIEVAEEQRKSDTNFSKSRVKVSPYRRSGRLADQTNTSIAANYTGNNTTMEMDITAGSVSSALDDSYLSSLRGIRGRRSYKLLEHYTPTPRPGRHGHVTVSGTDQPSRPTAPVVGRKRKPDGDVELATEAIDHHAAGKRARLFERIARPFRRSAGLTVQTAEIVGINTDLPLTSPVSVDLEPETLKAATVAPPLHAAPEQNKRCVVM